MIATFIFHYIYESISYVFQSNNNETTNKQQIMAKCYNVLHNIHKCFYFPTYFTSILFYTAGFIFLTSSIISSTILLYRLDCKWYRREFLWLHKIQRLYLSNRLPALFPTEDLSALHLMRFARSLENVTVAYYTTFQIKK